ncbi:MAG: hypothetical protein IJH34_12815 [Romboutsia sp.]|nr:hypothetical protein [Romboutsia sp.]
MNKKNILKVVAIISIVLNLILAFNLNNSINANNENEITFTYEEREDGRLIVDFSDYSWAVINHNKGEYIFQPSCMGDWDMTFDNYEHFKMAMATYLENKNTTIEGIEHYNYNEGNNYTLDEILNRYL